jgi:hypothetical protein
MPNTLKAHQSNVICGLGTFTHTVASTKMYFASAVCNENPTSSVSITISQSGSTSASITSTAPTSAQQAISVQKVFNCVSGDIITVAVTSAAAIDNQKNTVKTIVRVNEGTC